MSERVEWTCPKCGQVTLVSGPDVRECSVCETPIAGGPWWATDWVGLALHHFFYFAGMMFFFGAIGGVGLMLLASPFVESKLAGQVIGWMGGAAGAVFGFMKAEMARGRGETMYRRREPPGGNP